MKKKQVLGILLSAATLLAACGSSQTADNGRGNYTQEEEDPTPTKDEEPQATPTEEAAAVIEETPTPTKAEPEVEKSLFAIWEYSGYMDEAVEYELQDEFIDKDYDGDSITDKVYREWDQEAQTAKYSIEFGNGSKLIVPEFWETGFPHIQSADLTGNGFNEILVSVSYDTSTDPMSFGEMAMFSLDENSGVYEEIKLPLSDAADGSAGKGLDILYKPPVENTVSISVKQNGFKYDAELEESYLNGYWKGDLTNADYSETRVVFDAVMSEKAIHCSVQPFFKYGDVIEFDLVYNGKDFEIKDMKYIPMQ